jgi:PAS domain-containing protein
MIRYVGWGSATKRDIARKSELRSKIGGPVPRAGLVGHEAGVGQNLEDALRESEARFSLFMDHLPGIAFLKDLHGRYVFVSPGFVKLSGRAPGLCVG